MLPMISERTVPSFLSAAEVSVNEGGPREPASASGRTNGPAAEGKQANGEPWNRGAREPEALDTGDIDGDGDGLGDCVEPISVAHQNSALAVDVKHRRISGVRW
jgi:hypothetical protein